jgi:SAM-dependent methyltransferase
MKNQDKNTVEGFGDEWSRFDQSDLPEDEQSLLFDEYFSVFPWKDISRESVGFDLGCGSGRWAKSVAPKVKKLICIDPSNAIDIAKKNLSNFDNCEFESASVDDIPIDNNSMDFGYSLGVLHHVPDTEMGIKQCVEKLKKGSPLLLYLYYRFDNRPFWFRFIWSITDLLRKIISKMPYGLRYIFSQIIAVLVYFPLARTALYLGKLNLNVTNFPLSSYKNLSFYTMRTDALDRFGTRLEQRFTRKEIKNMMENAGLEHIKFSNSKPFWVAVGYKKSETEQS